jgi:hypothetical protein
VTGPRTVGAPVSTEGSNVRRYSGHGPAAVHATVVRKPPANHAGGHPRRGPQALVETLAGPGPWSMATWSTATWSRAPGPRPAGPRPAGPRHAGPRSLVHTVPGPHSWSTRSRSSRPRGPSVLVHGLRVHLPWSSVPTGPRRRGPETGRRHGPPAQLRRSDCGPQVCPGRRASDRLAPHPRVLAQCRVPHGPRRPALDRNRGPRPAGPLVHGPVVHGPVVHGPLAAAALVHGALVHGALVHGPLVHGPVSTALWSTVVRWSHSPDGPLVRVGRGERSGPRCCGSPRPGRTMAKQQAAGVWPRASHRASLVVRRAGADAVHGERDRRAVAAVNTAAGAIKTRRRRLTRQPQPDESTLMMVNADSAAVNMQVSGVAADAVTRSRPGFGARLVGRGYRRRCCVVSCPGEGGGSVGCRWALG